MKPLNRTLVVSVGIVALAVGSLASALMVRFAGRPIMVTPVLSLLFVVIGVWLLVGGGGVRRLTARRETWVTPVGAARIAVLARSSAYVMSGCGGFLAGVAAVAFTRLWAPAMAFSAWSSLAGAVGAVFACVCAVVVERWCIDSNSSGEDEGRGVPGRA